MASAGKLRSVAIVSVVQVLAMSLWFISAAVLPELTAEGGLSPGRAAALSSAVQLGFVAGALAFAAWGLADRFDPRRVLALCAGVAAAANLAFVFCPIGGAAQVALRALTGACLAGVYPVGMKIAVGWGARDRGLLIGLVVGAVTLGSATPHLLALAGGADWRVAVTTASALAVAGGGLVLLAGLGPGHARAATLDPGALALAWTDRRIRLAYLGYLGHMWELYAFWAWIGAASTVALGARGDPAQAAAAARILTFCAIALGGLACAPAGWFADRIGKARVARLAMLGSAVSALAAAAVFHGPAWLLALAVLAWGATIIPDSAQFSALVADAAPPERAGSLLTFQTALGFTLTFFTVQATPMAAAALGWPLTFAIMALGPLAGAEAMRRLERLDRG